jgi:hypothetical protein
LGDFEVKGFFFEKKKQKTFLSFGPVPFRRHRPKVEEKFLRRFF